MSTGEAMRGCVSGSGFRRKMKRYRQNWQGRWRDSRSMLAMQMCMIRRKAMKDAVSDWYALVTGCICRRAFIRHRRRFCLVRPTMPARRAHMRSLPVAI